MTLRHLVALFLVFGLAVGAAHAGAVLEGPDHEGPGGTWAAGHDVCSSEDPVANLLWIVTCCVLEEDEGWTHCPLDKYFEEGGDAELSV